MRYISGETGMVPMTGKERPMLWPEAASIEARFEPASLHQDALSGVCNYLAENPRLTALVLAASIYGAFWMDKVLP